MVFTSFENSVIEALRLVVGKDLERIAIVSDLYNRRSRIVAKFKNFPGPVPLKRLGDGAQRLFGIAVALANCQDGILLIDEVENGIHFSIQPALWRMIFTAARKGNIQVFAATHGWDCIVGFAIAANQSPEVGALIRLEQFKQQIDAIHYSEEELEVAAQQRIEVR